MSGCCRKPTAFPGIALILRIDLVVGLIRRETRYLITSLWADEVSPAQLLRLVRYSRPW
jgi:hypothetical protein